MKAAANQSVNVGREWAAEQRAALLAQVPLFAALPQAGVQELAARFVPVPVARGAFLIHVGQVLNAVQLLAVGRLKMVRSTPVGRQIVLRLINPGELVVLAGPDRAMVSVQALDPAVILQLPAADFDRYLTRYPALAQAVINDLGRRLREAETRIVDAESADVEMRLARTLIRLTVTSNQIALSRQDLGDLTGTTLSTTSRILSRWHRQGLILALRERVVILDHDQLAQIAAEE